MVENDRQLSAPRERLRDHDFRPFGSEDARRARRPAVGGRGVEAKPGHRGVGVAEVADVCRPLRRRLVGGLSERHEERVQVLAILLLDLRHEPRRKGGILERSIDVKLHAHHDVGRHRVIDRRWGAGGDRRRRRRGRRELSEIVADVRHCHAGDDGRVPRVGRDRHPRPLGIVVEEHGQPGGQRAGVGVEGSEDPLQFGGRERAVVGGRARLGGRLPHLGAPRPIAVEPQFVGALEKIVGSAVGRVEDERGNPAGGRREKCLEADVEIAGRSAAE